MIEFEESEECNVCHKCCYYSETKDACDQPSTEIRDCLHGFFVQRSDGISDADSSSSERLKEIIHGQNELIEQLKGEVMALQKKVQEQDDRLAAKDKA